MFFWFGANPMHRRWVRGSGKKFWNIDPDDLKGKLPAFLPDVPVVREDFADYLGLVRAWDEMIGVFLDELERIGELENTMIVLSGDHGMPGMPHGKTNLDDFSTPAPSFEKLASETSVVYADIDASPTKAWMLHHRGEPKVKPLFELGFNKRPAEELYDLKKDPDQMHNVADKSQYAEVKKRLRTKLMNHLRATGDPRVVGKGDAFDYPPYSWPGLANPN